MQFLLLEIAFFIFKDISKILYLKKQLIFFKVEFTHSLPRWT